MKHLKSNAIPKLTYFKFRNYLYNQGHIFLNASNVTAF